MESLGLLRIVVVRGINLVVRDSRSSDPYAVVENGPQRVKTRVVKNDCNPVWEEALTICITDLDVPIILTVHDLDTFTGDDRMGDAVIDIKPYVECLPNQSIALSDSAVVATVQPSKDNCLACESSIFWDKGKLKQGMVLKLRNVEHGEVEIQIEWIHHSGSRGL